MMTLEKIIAYLKQLEFDVKISGMWLLATTYNSSNHAIAYEKLFDIAQTYVYKNSFGIKIWLGRFDI